MTSDEIKDLVRKEIGNHWSASNTHGVNLQKCLVQPQKLKFADSPVSKGCVDLWLVLEEDPVTKGGYQIVFDEQAQMFGLAITDVHHGPVFLGAYDSFMETLESM